MKKTVLEVDCSKLPVHIMLKGESGKNALFILKAAGRKLGAQLIKG